MSTYYKILGLTSDASPDQIKAAYRKLAKDLHPDTCVWGTLGEEAFKNVKEAYDNFANPSKRALYDSQLYWQTTPIPTIFP